MAYIKCQNLSVGYAGETLIENINFEVHEHDYLCIVGENGVGKSTLMKTLLGLVDKKEGNVEFGKNINRKEVGYLPQQTALQKDFPATVMEVVLSGNLSKIALRPFYRKKEKERALLEIEQRFDDPVTPKLMSRLDENGKMQTPALQDMYPVSYTHLTLPTILLV